jgi:cytochrome d ubiquinol oxidase subunit I
MRTADAVSRIATVQVATSLAAFLAVYGILGFVAISLLVRYARKGPAAPDNA